MFPISFAVAQKGEKTLRPGTFLLCHHLLTGHHASIIELSLSGNQVQHVNATQKSNSNFIVIFSKI